MKIEFRDPKYPVGLKVIFNRIVDPNILAIGTVNRVIFIAYGDYLGEELGYSIDKLTYTYEIMVGEDYYIRGENEILPSTE